MGIAKAVALSAENFAFSQTEIRVKKGETVRVTLTNNEGMHDFVIDEFDTRTKVLQAGQSETVEFVADQVGTFEYYCSVGQHRQMGMKGSLIVE
jgi:plastocyanin